MRLALITGNVLIGVDFRDLGLNKITEELPVRTGELALLNGDAVVQAKGRGARVWDLGGEYAASSSAASQGWAQIIAWRNLLEQKKLLLSQYIGSPINPSRIADVYIDGSPRREWIELINGSPRVYRWRLRLKEALDG